jgi:RNA polymerase sigma-70 factor (ECF subfamily)
MTSPSAASGSAETELVRRVQGGDAEASDTLVRQFLPRAFAVAYRVLGHREDAEDVVQEAFVAALRGIDRFELGRPFAPWLYRIVVNRAISARRGRTLRLTETLGDDAASAAGSPLADTLRGEVRERFMAALARLPERQRLSVEWHDVDGLTADEIGALLGISGGTVRWYLHQARQVLRQALAPLRGAVEDDDHVTRRL